MWLFDSVIIATEAFEVFSDGSLSCDVDYAFILVPLPFLRSFLWDDDGDDFHGPDVNAGGVHAAGTRVCAAGPVCRCPHLLQGIPINDVGQLSDGIARVVDVWVAG